MRIELTDENEKKLVDFEQQLSKQGVVMSQTQIANIILGSMESVSLKQIIEVNFKTIDKQGKIHRSTARKQSNWVMRTGF